MSKEKGQRLFRIVTPEEKRLAVAKIMSAPESPAYMIKIIEADSQRTLDQNSLMWSMLGQVEKRGTWHAVKFCREDWKEIFTSALKGEKRRMVPGLDGGFIVLGERTSKMSVKAMMELIEFMFYLDAASPECFVFDGFVKRASKEEERALLEYNKCMGKG